MSVIINALLAHLLYLQQPNRVTGHKKEPIPCIKT